MLLLSFAVLFKCIFLIFEFYKDVKKSCMLSVWSHFATSLKYDPTRGVVSFSCLHYLGISVLQIHIYEEFVPQ